jgi:hypothetical protein
MRKARRSRSPAPRPLSSAIRLRADPALPDPARRTSCRSRRSPPGDRTGRSVKWRDWETTPRTVRCWPGLEVELPSVCAGQRIDGQSPLRRLAERLLPRGMERQCGRRCRPRPDGVYADEARRLGPRARVPLRRVSEPGHIAEVVAFCSRREQERHRNRHPRRRYRADGDGGRPRERYK